MKKIYLSLFIFVGLGLIIYVYVSNPTLGPIFPCVFQRVTGLYCPGCGMTRAVNSIMHFDLYQAFRYNALVFLCGPTGIIGYILLKKGYNNANKLIYGMLIIALTYGILRNIGMFSWLAPTVV